MTRLRPACACLPSCRFESLFTILKGPAEPLSGDRWERKNQLMVRMKDGRLESICQVIRDLVVFRQTKKLNDYDNAILDRAQNFLINEWQISLGVSRAQAERELQALLGGKP